MLKTTSYLSACLLVFGTPFYLTADAKADLCAIVPLYLI